jgi:hypothetical protein
MVGIILMHDDSPGFRHGQHGVYQDYDPGSTFEDLEGYSVVESHDNPDLEKEISSDDNARDDDYLAEYSARAIDPGLTKGWIIQGYQRLWARPPKGAVLIYHNPRATAHQIREVWMSAAASAGARNVSASNSTYAKSIGHGTSSATASNHSASATDQLRTDTGNGTRCVHDTRNPARDLFIPSVALATQTNNRRDHRCISSPPLHSIRLIPLSPRSIRPPSRLQPSFSLSLFSSFPCSLAFTAQGSPIPRHSTATHTRRCILGRTRQIKGKIEWQGEKYEVERGRESARERLTEEKR